jgi:hypothetical protein
LPELNPNLLYVTVIPPGTKKGRNGPHDNIPQRISTGDIPAIKAACRLLAGKNAISSNHCIFHHVASPAGLAKSGQSGP